jgi:hypothetical protein
MAFAAAGAVGHVKAARVPGFVYNIPKDTLESAATAVKPALGQTAPLILAQIRWTIAKRQPSCPLPTTLRAPMKGAGRPPPQRLQRENRLPNLAPESRLIAAEPVECAIVEVDHAQETLRDVRPIGLS